MLTLAFPRRLFKCPFPVLSSQMVVSICGEPFAPYTNGTTLNQILSSVLLTFSGTHLDNKSSHHWHLSSDMSNGSRLKFLEMDEESKETHRKRVLAIMEAGVPHTFISDCVLTSAQFARLCENWNYDMACNREAELKDLRAQRLQW